MLVCFPHISIVGCSASKVNPHSYGGASDEESEESSFARVQVVFEGKTSGARPSYLFAGIWNKSLRSQFGRASVRACANGSRPPWHMEAPRRRYTLPPALAREREWGASGARLEAHGDVPSGAVGACPPASGSGTLPHKGRASGDI